MIAPNDPPEISLLHATRGRPLQAIETRNKWLSLAYRPEVIEHIFAAQDDDEASADLPNLVTTPPPPKWASSSVDNWNAAAQASTGRLLAVIADDLLPFPGWDDRLLRVARGAGTDTFAIHMADNLRDDGLVCHPILSRAAYERLGNVFHPEYWGVYCDNDFVARCDKEEIPIIKVVGGAWNHVHPLDGKTPLDDVTSLQNTEEAYRYGRDVCMAFWSGLNAYHLANPVHSVWVGSPLGLMERLTLAQLTRHGHQVRLITDRDHDDLPDGVRTVPLDDCLPNPVPFRGIPHPGIPNGGIGSFAHWSDLVAYWTLHWHGGAWIQMDVAITRPIVAPFYTWTPFQSAVSPVCMMLPRGSKLALHIYERILHSTLMGWQGNDWHMSMMIQNQVMKEMRIPVKGFSKYYDCGAAGESPFNRPLTGQPPSMIHWSNATNGGNKERPVPGSFYHSLCQDAHLI